MRQIFGAVHQLDKSNLVLKLRAARQRKKVATGRCEGRLPYGDHEGEQDVLNHMRGLHAVGGNWETIASTLNNEGVTTRSGGKWYPATVRKILIRK
jgi:hypothetical protein